MLGKRLKKVSFQQQKLLSLSKIPQNAQNGCVREVRKVESCSVICSIFQIQLKYLYTFLKTVARFQSVITT